MFVCNNCEYRCWVILILGIMCYIEEIVKEIVLIIFVNYINFVFGIWCVFWENRIFYEINLIWLMFGGLKFFYCLKFCVSVCVKYILG